MLLSPRTCRLDRVETWPIAVNYMASKGYDLNVGYGSTALWTSDLLESIYTCGSGIPNLQIVQSLYIFRCEFKVKDIRIGLDPFCGLGGWNGDQTTDSAFRQKCAYPFCKLHLRITCAQFFLYFSPNRFTTGSSTRAGLARTNGQNAMTRMSCLLQ